jgi:hypothetical protein
MNTQDTSIEKNFLLPGFIRSSIRREVRRPGGLEHRPALDDYRKGAMAQRKGYARYQRICGRRIAADVQMNRPTVQRHSVCGYYFRDCLTFAACLPSAVRVFFGKRFNVCLRLAAWRPS